MAKKEEIVHTPSASDDLSQIWRTLSAIDCSDKTEKVQGQGNFQATYLSWVWAWGIMKAHYPDFTHRVLLWDNKPYFEDENLGYMVGCEVTINGHSHTEYLMVTDNNNKAKKRVPYSIATSRGERQVEACTMFDINTAIKRCMVKCFALFGLGYYIYAGEDIPQVILSSAEMLNKAIEEVHKATSLQVLTAVYQKYPSLAQDDVFRSACTDRKNEIMSESSNNQE